MRPLSVWRARHSRSQRGQTLAEFALVLPLFLAMLFGAIDLGRVVWASDALANAAREGARFASVRGDSEITPTATKDQIRAHTLQYAIAAGNNVIVTVCYSAVDFANSNVACTGNTDQAGASNGRGNLVTVRITANVPVLTGSLLGMSGFAVSGSSSVLINN